MGDSAIHAAAGAVGGCISMGLTYPLVNLSTRAAVQSKQEELSIPEAIRKTLKEEGLAGLYSGLSSSLFGILVTNGVYYGFYEEARSILIKRRDKATPGHQALSTGEGILAGLIAGSITTITTNPIWTVQTAQSAHAVVVPKTNSETGEVLGGGQTQKVKLSATDAIARILKTDGLKGFWRGIGPALILVINPVIQYTTFERLTSLLLSYRHKKGLPASGRNALSDWDLFILGALSKLVATGSTYPYIVVKSRLQAATHKYKSSLSAVLHILQKEGLKGLYGGLLPKLIQSMLTAAFLFVAQRRIFEAVKLAMATTRAGKIASR